MEFEGVTTPQDKFLYAVYLGASIEELRVLLKKGGDVNYGGKEHNPPLCFAVENDDVRLTKFLLEAGAKMGLEGDPDDWLPAYQAVLNGNTEMLALLIQYGADINQTTPGGKSPLFQAVKRGHADMVHLILEQHGVHTHFNQAHSHQLISMTARDPQCRQCLHAVNTHALLLLQHAEKTRNKPSHNKPSHNKRDQAGTPGDAGASSASAAGVGGHRAKPSQTKRGQEADDSGRNNKRQKTSM